MQRSILKQISIDKASTSTKVKLIRVERRFSESKLTAPIELVKTKSMYEYDHMIIQKTKPCNDRNTMSICNMLKL